MHHTAFSWRVMRIVFPHRLALCLGAIAVHACARPQPTVRTEPRTETRTETHTEIVAVPAAAPGGISFAQLRAVVPRIRALRAEPPRIDLVVGQRIDVASALRIVALDSAGRELGRLTHFDQFLDSPAAALDGPGAVRGLQPGEGLLILEVSLFVQFGGQGPPPRLEIPVVVRMPSPTPPRPS